MFCVNIIIDKKKHAALTASSMKPQQCSEGEPLSPVEAVYRSRCCGNNEVWLKPCNKCL